MTLWTATCSPSNRWRRYRYSVRRVEGSLRTPVEIFGDLLDRSVEQIAAVSADARDFDADLIYRVSDVWDNNTSGLMSAALAGNARRRDKVAMAGLRWMAELGPTRRAWMVDVHPALDAVLPEVPERTVYRDFRGHVRPIGMPLTAGEAASLGEDYDLPGAVVRHIKLEHRVDGLTAILTVEVTRRYPTSHDVSDDPALLSLKLAPVKDLRFDAVDRRGLVVSHPETGVELRIGADGNLRAAAGEVWLEDWLWHESRAGRAADAVVPPGVPSVPGAPRRRWRCGPRIWTLEARPPQYRVSDILLDTMRKIRMVRFRDNAAEVPVHDLCRVLGPAGSDIVAAGAHRWFAQTRAFGGLEQAWARRWEAIDESRAVLGNGPGHVRYAGFTAPHTAWGAPRNGRAVLNVAVPGTDPAAPWRLAYTRIDHPGGFTAHSAALDGIHEVRLDDDGFAVGAALTARTRRV